MADTITFYEAAHRLEMTPGVFRDPGELVPEALAWWRLDSWVTTGKLKEVQVSPAKAKAAISKYVTDADEAERLTELAGLGDAVLEGPHRTPRIIRTHDREPIRDLPAQDHKAAALRERTSGTDVDLDAENTEGATVDNKVEKPAAKPAAKATKKPAPIKKA